MSKSQNSRPRKRQRIEHPPPLPNGVTQPQATRPTLNNQSAEPQSPAVFWDNLSKVWLTKRALRELDRRSSRVHWSCRPRQPVTQRALAALKKKSRQPSQPAAEFLSYCTPTGLKDIKYFARHGGPDISDLRGYPEPVNPFKPEISSSRPSRGRKRGSASTNITKPITNTKPTDSSSPYDQNFRQRLVDGGVYPYGYQYPDGRKIPKPSNWAEMKQRLEYYRPSLSPSTFSEGKHKQFLRADARVSKENKATKAVVPIIEAAKPDLYYGARPEAIKRQIRNDLSRQIIPSKQDHLPAAPNFFLKAQGPDGSAAVVGRQVCYDGALGVRGMQSLQSYGQSEPVYDNNASTISSIYLGGSGLLLLYANHAAQPGGPGTRPEYYINQLGGYAMTHSPDTFRQGVAAYRNLRDWAKEQRDEAITRANERADFNNDGPSLELVSHASRTSIHEDDTTVDSEASETSSDPLTSRSTVPTKRSSEYSKPVPRHRNQHQHQSKRRNFGEPR